MKEEDQTKPLDPELDSEAKEETIPKVEDVLIPGFKKLSGEKIDVHLYNKTRDEVSKDIVEFNKRMEELSSIINSNSDDSDKTTEAKEELEKIIKQLNDSKSLISRLIEAEEYNRRYTDNQEFITNVIGKFIESSHKFEEAVGKFNLTLNAPVEKIKETAEIKPVMITGKQGSLLLLRKFRGVCKVPLFNSGMWIVLKCPGLGELNDFFETVSMEEDQYGRLLGGHYYLTYDYFLKEKAIEIIHANIIDSSLKDFDKIGTFLKAFDLNDYDVALNAICYLMNRDGVDMDIPCIDNDECQHIESVCIDLSKIRYNNYSILTDKNINTMMEATSGSLTLNDIDEYKRSFNIVYNVFSEKEGVVINCSSPSIGKHIETGKKITAKLINGIHSDKVTDKRFVTKLNSLSVFSYSQWVESMDFYPHTTDWMKTEDPSIIQTTLENLIQKGDPILKRIQDEFIMKIKTSILCYPGVKCPKCGAEPSDIKSEYFPADIQTVFFFLSSIALTKPGKDLERI